MAVSDRNSTTKGPVVDAPPSVTNLVAVAQSVAEKLVQARLRLRQVFSSLENQGVSEANGQDAPEPNLRQLLDRCEGDAAGLLNQIEDIARSLGM